MACNRTMAAILEARHRGFTRMRSLSRKSTANNFEIKHGLLNLVQNKQFFGNDKEDPHRYPNPNSNGKKGGFHSLKRLARFGWEVGSIRRIQGLDMAYWGFLGVGTTLDIFQNIHILYLRYGVLRSSGYGVLGFIPLRSLKGQEAKKRNRSRTHKLKRLYKVGLSARVESFGDEESLGEDASKQRRINAIDADEDITLVNVQDDADNEMFDVNALNGKKVFVAGLNENVVEEVVDAAQNMEGYKLKDLKSKGFDSIQEMFNKAFKRVNRFKDFRTELVEGKKRAGEELIQESTKKQKVDDNKETAELKQYLEIIPDE
ncbi:hypothetical protein Tco_0668929 [Tanacetum coccineum]